MAEEIKAAAASSEEEKAATDAAEKSEESAGHIDYKSQFEGEKARREKAEAVLRRLKEKKDEFGEEDKPDLTEQIHSVLSAELDERFGKLSSELRAEKIEATISKVVSDPDEAKLVRYHYDNSIRQSGDIALDIENARAIANKKRHEAELEEMKAAAVSKETVSSGSGAGRKPASSFEEEVKLTPIDRKIVDDLRQKYVLSSDAIHRIMKGESLDELIRQGIVKNR